MTHTSNVCEHPEHEGSRLVARLDLVEERTEWRRLTDQGREAVRIRQRVCKACMRRDLEYLPSGQGALL